MNRMKPFILMTALFISLVLQTSPVDAKSTTIPDFTARKALYLKTGAVTGVPWTLIAACDQYARNMADSQPKALKNSAYLDIPFSNNVWTGPVHPAQSQNDPLIIHFFGGQGRDGNGDGIADRKNDQDRLFTIAEKIAAAGPGEQNNRIGLWNLYHRGKAVEMIEAYAAIYSAYNTVDLSGHAFPLPLRANYDYESSWGAKRGWGGLRIHEGTDLFADYGTTVYATCYGMVEMIGWNKYGGWRVGIRDINGDYHYFAHLNGYAPHLHRGSITRPGEEIGYVGSSGYGPKGTMGKFPPHLHYGLYLDNGRSEYSVDPYPSLRLWEREALSRRP